MKNTFKKPFSIVLVALMIVAALSFLASASATQPTVIVTYSNLGRSPIFWGSVVPSLRAAGYNVIDLVPRSYKLADYEVQIEQQIQKTPHCTIVTFSDSDLPVTVAAGKLWFDVDRIIFVESVEAWNANPQSDQLLGYAAVSMVQTLPSWIVTSIGSDKSTISSMLDGLVYQHPANFDALVAATADGTAIYAYADVAIYSQIRDWSYNLILLHHFGVHMNAIVADHSPEQATTKWAQQNGIPYITIYNSGHLVACEQPTQTINALKWELKGNLG